MTARKLNTRRFNDEFDFPATEEQEVWASKFECPCCGPSTYMSVTTKKTCLRCDSKQCPNGQRCPGQSLMRGESRRTDD